MASKYREIDSTERAPELLANSYRFPIKTESDGVTPADEVALEFIDDHFEFADEDGNVNKLLQSKHIAITATSDGLTTGLIPAGSGRVRVTSSNADYIVTLPEDAEIGDVIEISVGANGCELRTDDPTATSLNNVTGSGKELAMGANTVFVARKTGATAWIATTFSNVGAPTGGGTPD